MKNLNLKLYFFIIFCKNKKNIAFFDKKVRKI
jgi:hypothetical protein